MYQPAFLFQLKTIAKNHRSLVTGRILTGLTVNNISVSNDDFFTRITQTRQYLPPLLFMGQVLIDKNVLVAVNIFEIFCFS